MRLIAKHKYTKFVLFKALIPILSKVRGRQNKKEENASCMSLPSSCAFLMRLFTIPKKNHFVRWTEGTLGLMFSLQIPIILQML